MNNKKIIYYILAIFFFLFLISSVNAEDLSETTILNECSATIINSNTINDKICLDESNSYDIHINDNKIKDTININDTDSVVPVICQTEHITINDGYTHNFVN